jgi:hypothetical protein
MGSVCTRMGEEKGNKHIEYVERKKRNDEGKCGGNTKTKYREGI